LNKAPKLSADGLYHLANGKALDTAGKEVDTSDISNVDISVKPDLHIGTNGPYHLVNGELQDPNGVIVSLVEKKPFDPKIGTEGPYTLSNGELQDPDGVKAIFAQ
jgi:hypothetical protein